MVAPEDRQRAINNLRQVLETGSAGNIEYALLRKDGSRFPAEVSTSVVFGSDGRPQSLVGVARDITARNTRRSPAASARCYTCPPKATITPKLPRGCASARTVETHRANVMRKLGLHSQTDLIRYALKRGILPMEE